MARSIRDGRGARCWWRPSPSRAAARRRATTDESTIGGTAAAGSEEALGDSGSLERDKRGLGPEEDGVLEGRALRLRQRRARRQRARRARAQRRVAAAEPPRQGRARGTLRQPRHHRVQPRARREAREGGEGLPGRARHRGRSPLAPSATARSCRSARRRPSPAGRATGACTSSRRSRVARRRHGPFHRARCQLSLARGAGASSWSPLVR